MSAYTKPRAGSEDAILGQRIRKVRKRLGVTLTDLGNDIEVSYQQIQKYEKGQNRISAVRLNQLMRIFNVPWTCFFEERDIHLLDVYRLDTDEPDIQELWEQINDQDIRLYSYLLLQSLNRVFKRQPENS